MHVKGRQRLVHCPMTLFHDWIYAEGYMDYPKHPAATRPAEPNLVAINSMVKLHPLTPVAMRRSGCIPWRLGAAA
jgi:hypothetical protein